MASYALGFLQLIISLDLHIYHTRERWGQFMEGIHRLKQVLMHRYLRLPYMPNIVTSNSLQLLKKIQIGSLVREEILAMLESHEPKLFFHTISSFCGLGGVCFGR